MKTEKIDFHSFMNGSHKEKKHIQLNVFKNKNKLYSFISPMAFLSGGTWWVLGAGAVAIGLVIYENIALKSGDIDKADRISLFGNVLLQGGGIALALYFLTNTPLLRWL